MELYGNILMPPVPYALSVSICMPVTYCMAMIGFRVPRNLTHGTCVCCHWMEDRVPWCGCMRAASLYDSDPMLSRVLVRPWARTQARRKSAVCLWKETDRQGKPVH